MGTQTVLPRWRGFNLLEMFTCSSLGDFVEDDFRWISDWGFDFVRMPLCYTLWIDDDHPFKINEGKLERVDRALDLGWKHRVHVCLNFHRAPGYSVNAERKEPFNLWKDAAACDAFCLHWETFARRYRGTPSSELSFNLVNEPGAISDASMSRADHERVVRAAVAAIRKVDPDRLVIVDGLSWGNEPCPELADLGPGVAQSCRAYAPFQLTHYKATWVNSKGWPEPKYPDPGRADGQWDRARLEAHYAKWADLASKGVGVHCGEGGAHCFTPHGVLLRWLRDVLDVLRSRNIGFALWNFRGAFGLLDSNRADVNYEDWHGRKLDRELLSLMQEY